MDISSWHFVKTSCHVPTLAKEQKLAFWKVRLLFGDICFDNISEIVLIYFLFKQGSKPCCSREWNMPTLSLTFTCLLPSFYAFRLKPTLSRYCSSSRFTLQCQNGIQTIIRVSVLFCGFIYLVCVSLHRLRLSFSYSSFWHLKSSFQGKITSFLIRFHTCFVMLPKHQR